MLRKCLSVLSLAVVAAMPLATPGAAQDVRASVGCGATTCFYIRVPAEGKDPYARASSAIDVINKYLGGKVGKVTTKPAGKNVRLLLNNELVVTVTPADAEAEKQKSVAALAKRWATRLENAFNDTKAGK